MSHHTHQISEFLTCPYCKNKYNDPRVMECGDSFCMPCIELLTSNGGIGFNCPVCDEFHQEPLKGYFKNHNLAKICEKQAAVVSHDTLAHTLSSQLGEIQLNLDKLVLDFGLGVNIIKDYCDTLRNEVQLTTRQTVEHIKKLSMNLIQQIESYESFSIQNYGIEITYKDFFSDFVAQAYAFISKWAAYLNRNWLEDGELMQASNNARSLIEQIKKENKMLLKRVFKDNVIKFNQTGLPDSIGIFIKDD